MKVARTFVFCFCSGVLGAGIYTGGIRASGCLLTLFGLTFIYLTKEP